MSIQLLGAILTFAACAYVGFSRAAAYTKAERQLQQLILALEFMQRELEFRMPPLEELCALTAGQLSGTMRSVFLNLSRQLEGQALPQAEQCMEQTLENAKLTDAVKANLRLLGKTMGRFDLQGQLSGLTAVKALASRDLSGLLSHRDENIRFCRTLALCAGAALVILFI